ncbi:MAG: flagellar hook-associated protein FlgK, partial [Pseudonocardiales bacterium]|nr:flagellar hook-associated protein FlgK [Pseudonocardiales bacterium]
SPSVPTLYAKPAGQGGVTISGTTRLNDPVLDARSRTEHARGALADTTANQLSAVEAVFPEPSDHGLSEQLNDFWNSWSAVANNPGSDAPRTVLLQKAATVSSTLNAMSTSLGGIATSTAQSLGRDVGAANAAAGQLAALNGQIAVATATGANANPLLDQRDTLLAQLGALVGGVATINANGSADVIVGGQPVVTGVTATAVAVNASNQVTVGGTAVALAGGSAAAEVTALATTIPGYQSQLDAIANALASSVNGAQAGGYDLTGAVGTALFTGSGAAAITVAVTDPKKIAASATPGGGLDGSNALTTANLGTAAGGPDGAYAVLVGSIGSASALASQQQTTQSAVTSSVDALRNAASGVSYDEEVSHMLTYQHAYSAAARVLTTVDGMLDTLINHTGLVGLQ